MHSVPVQDLVNAPPNFQGTFQAYEITLEFLCDIYKTHINNGVVWNGQRWPEECHREINHYMQTGQFPVPADPTADGSNDGGASVTGGISVAASLMNITIVTGQTETSTVVSELSGVVGI